jgi:WXG100 family type VII secretion target
MATERRVDVAELRSAGTQVGAEQSLLSGIHTETAAGIAAAQAGWVGSSSAALSEVTARWDALSQTHGAAIGNHGGHMRGSAQQFGDTEDRNAQAVAEVGAAPDIAG